MDDTPLAAIPEMHLGAALSNAMAPALAQHQGAMAELSRSLIPSLNLIPKFDFRAMLGAQAVVRAAMPDLGWINQLNQQLANELVPKLSMPTIHLPPMPVLNVGLTENLIKFVRGMDWEKLARRAQMPSNWPDGLSENLSRLVEIVNGEGIPVAWVPRAPILEALISAESSTARSELLISRRDEILEDCEDWAEHLDDELVLAHLPVAKKVLRACRDGHWEVAAISAVFVVHTIVESLQWVSDRQRVEKHHRLTMDLPFSKLLEQATRAPLVLFYDDWSPKSGKPRPTHLTRHVVSHQLGEDQVSARNCVVAVMLMTSLLVTIEQLELGREAVAA
jgi:hypothetical protein